MIGFIFLAVVIIFMAVFFTLIPFYVDKRMTKDCGSVCKLKKSSYKELEKLFLNEKWEFDYIYPTSLFSNNAYYHAGIIRFGDVGYLVNIITWFRVILLQKKIRKNLEGYTKYRKPYIK